jgi:glycosyltransferase involved in cell wall biosynthesis
MDNVQIYMKQALCSRHAPGRRGGSSGRRSSKMRVEISVVVCAHAEARWVKLGKAVRSLEVESRKPREIIVSVDHNERVLRRVRADLCVLAVPNTEHRGLGGARNSGIAAASGSVVAFLDDDKMASPEWLSLLAQSYCDPEVAAVGGRAEPAWEASRPPWFPPEFDWVVGYSYLGMPATSEEVRNLFGCNLSFRRDLLELLTGFRLGYGCDETELCIWLRQRWPEKKVIYVPEAKVVHHVPANRTQLRSFRAQCYFEGGSKAMLARLVGHDAALASDYRYTRETLPNGLRRALAMFARCGDISALARGGALVAGMIRTTAGYAVASIRTAKAARVRGWSGSI